MSKSRLREYIPRCQVQPETLTDTRARSLTHIQKISAAALSTFFIFAIGISSSQVGSAVQGRDLPDRLFDGQSAPERIAARFHDTKLVQPPMEETFFPMNFDGQARVDNIDTTVNLTVAINQFYYNPKWRGEVWTPFDQVELIERASRLMSTWKEYNEANQYRVLNGVNVFFERFSGFGP